MTTVFTTLYDAHASRLEELKFCIARNAENPLVDRLAFLCEGNPEHLLTKFEVGNLKPVAVFETDRRASYRDFFNRANQAFPEDIVLVCNTDIYFDETLALLPHIEPAKDFVVLTRYDRYSNGELEIMGGANSINGASNDAWIFRPPLPDFAEGIQCGVIGCDTYLAQKAEEAGLRVRNPCLSVRAIHWHPSRTRNNQTPGGLCYWHAPGYRGKGVPPCR
ncbi:MAG: hypothetical protein ABT940_09495 [Alphaproteobacteria bacterium]